MRVNIQRGFKNRFGNTYDNLISINFDNIKELRASLGLFVLETKKEVTLFATNKDEYNGIILHEMKSVEDYDYAFRIYRDYQEYKYKRHYDDRLVSMLHSKQRLVKDTDFPIGIVCVDNYVVGQIIRYYKDNTKFKNIINKRDSSLFYLRIVRILLELVNNNIYYLDIHPNNFLIYNNDLKLIDFEPSFVSFKEEDLKYLVYNLVNMINRINSYLGIELIKDCNNLEGIVNALSKEYVLSKEKPLIVS